MSVKIRKWQGKNDPLYEEGWVIIPGGLRPIVKKPPQQQVEKPEGASRKPESPQKRKQRLDD